MRMHRCIGEMCGSACERGGTGRRDVLSFSCHTHTHTTSSVAGSATSSVATNQRVHVSSQTQRLHTRACVCACVCNMLMSWRHFGRAGMQTAPDNVTYSTCSNPRVRTCAYTRVRAFTAPRVSRMFYVIYLTHANWCVRTRTRTDDAVGGWWQRGRREAPAA